MGFIYYSVSQGKDVNSDDVPYENISQGVKPPTPPKPTYEQTQAEINLANDIAKGETFSSLYKRYVPNKVLDEPTVRAAYNLGPMAKKWGPAKETPEDLAVLGEGQTTEQKNKAAIMQEAETSLKEIENLYLNGPDGPLALSKKGDVLQMGARGEQLGANLIAGSNPQLKTYMRELKTMGPRLAKLAGDTGNIALQEQLRALEGLPKPTDTLEEALLTINSTRRRFGLPERDFSNIAGLKEVNSIIGGFKTPPTNQVSTQEQTNGQDNGFTNRLPNLPYKGLSGLLALFQKNPATAAITGAIGQGVGDISFAAQQVGKPFAEMTPEEIDRLQKMSGPDYYKQPLKTAGEFAGAKVIQNALSFLLGGVKTAKEFAGGQYTPVNKIAKILGLPGAIPAVATPVTADITSITPRVTELMKEKVTGQTASEFENYLPKVAKIYSEGKMSLQELISKSGELSGAWKSGTGNEVKDAAVNAARAIERRAVREVISKQGPIYDILYKSAAGQKVTKEMVKKIWWLVPSLGAFVWGVGQVKEGLQGGQGGS